MMPADLATRQALAALSTGVVWDVLRVMGLPHQALHHSIRSLDPAMTVCGPAFCVKGQSWLGTPPKALAGQPQPRYELFDHLYEDCVMLIDSGGYDEAVVMGENFAISAVAAGCRGFVIDGAIRDAASLANSRTPVFCRFCTPASSAGRWSIVAYEVPITLPGQTSSHVRVNPGDYVLADRDGAVIVPREYAAQVAHDAARVNAIEEAQRELLLAGKEDRQSIYERFDRFVHSAPVQKKSF